MTKKYRLRPEVILGLHKIRKECGERVFRQAIGLPRTTLEHAMSGRNISGKTADTIARAMSTETNKVTLGRILECVL